MQCKCNLQQGRTQREPGAYLHFGKGNAKGSAGLQLGMRRCEGPLYPKRRVQPWVGVTVSPSERSGNAPGHLSKLPVYQYRGTVQRVAYFGLQARDTTANTRSLSKWNVSFELAQYHALTAGVFQESILGIPIHVCRILAS
jgi:hypothetical protein